MAQPTPAEIRKARSFLVQKGVMPNQISPRKFAAAAKEQDVNFYELLKYIARLYDGQQNLQAFRKEIIREAVR